MKKIIIMADSVAEAKADLEMIEKAISIGAVSGYGSSKDGTMSLEMPSPRVEGIMAERMAEAYADNCPCCDEVFSSDYLDEPVEMDGKMVSRFIAEVCACDCKAEPKGMSLEDAMAMVYYGYLD